MAEKWMQKVNASIERRGTKGALTRQAKSVGETVSEFCSSKHTGTTAKRCGLAKAFAKARK